jgi:uncharacterized protein (DUF433 family)
MGKPEEYLDFVAPDEIRIKGHRIGIEHVLFAHLDQGVRPEALGSLFPTLSRAELDGVLAYYRLHRPEMDVYLKGVREREDAVFRQAEMSPSPAMRRVGELRAKLASEGKLPSQPLRRG